MCGRKACTLAPECIIKKLSVKRWQDQGAYKTSYNIAPTHRQAALYLDKSGDRCVRMMKCGPRGLVPANWNRDAPPEHTTNARAEGLTSNQLWRNIVKDKRCIVIGSGFYEWKDHKRPFFIRPKEDDLMAFAGLYDVRVDPKTGEEEWTYSVVTVQASQEVEAVHNRMPAILDTDEKRRLWLGEEKDAPLEKVIVDCCRPIKGLHIYEVNPSVNQVKNNTPDNLIPLAEYNKSGPIDKFFIKPKKEEAGVKESAVAVKEEQKLTERASKRGAPTPDLSKEDMSTKKAKTEAEPQLSEPDQKNTSS